MRSSSFILLSPLRMVLNAVISPMPSVKAHHIPGQKSCASLVAMGTVPVLNNKWTWFVINDRAKHGVLLSDRIPPKRSHLGLWEVNRKPTPQTMGFHMLRFV